MLVCPVQLITGDSVLVLVTSPGPESSYAAPQSPLGQNINAAENQQEYMNDFIRLNEEWIVTIFISVMPYGIS